MPHELAVTARAKRVREKGGKRPPRRSRRRAAHPRGGGAEDLALVVIDREQRLVERGSIRNEQFIPP